MNSRYSEKLMRKDSPSTKRTHLYWLHYRTLEKFISENLTLAKSPMLDFGAGSKPYKNYYPDGTITADADPTLKDSVDVLLFPGEALPFENSTFETFFLAQVLEHVVNPNFVMSEAYRVLKVGGQIIITAPFIWELHEIPHDYLRYTPYWYEETLKQLGFTEIEITPQGGDLATICQMFLLFLAHSKLGRKILKKPFIFIYNCMSDYLDSHANFNFMPLNYGVVATKKITEV